MNGNNLRINIDFKNDTRYFGLYAQTKNNKSSIIKDLLEIKSLKEMIKKRNQKNDLTL